MIRMVCISVFVSCLCCKSFPDCQHVKISGIPCEYLVQDQAAAKFAVIFFTTPYWGSK